MECMMQWTSSFSTSKCTHQLSPPVLWVPWLCCLPVWTAWRAPSPLFPVAFVQWEESETGAFIPWPLHSPSPAETWLPLFCSILLLKTQAARQPFAPKRPSLLHLESSGLGVARVLVWRTTSHCWLINTLLTPLWLLNSSKIIQLECHLLLPWALTKTKTKTKPKHTKNQINKVFN